PPALADRLAVPASDADDEHHDVVDHDVVHDHHPDDHGADDHHQLVYDDHDSDHDHDNDDHEHGQRQRPRAAAAGRERPVNTPGIIGGRYRLDRRLGAGGMSTLLLA